MARNRDMMSSRGLALKSRITLAFRKLNRLGYLAAQNVPDGQRSSAPYASLVRSIQPGEDVSAKVNANRARQRSMGIIWVPNHQISSLRRYRSALTVYYARAVYDGEIVGQLMESIHGALAEALRENDVEWSDVNACHGYYKNCVVPFQYVRCEVPDRVMDAADAAYDLGGIDAYNQIIEPTRKYPTGEEQ